MTFEARSDGEIFQLSAHGHAAAIWNKGVNGRELCVMGPDGTARVENVAPLEPHRWHSFRYVVTPQRMVITVDDKPVFSEDGAYDNFPSFPVGLESEYDSVLDVRNLAVEPL